MQCMATTGCWQPPLHARRDLLGTPLSWEPNTIIIDGPSLGQVMGVMSVMDVMGEQA